MTIPAESISHRLDQPNLADVLDRTGSPSELLHRIFQIQIDGLKVAEHGVSQYQGKRVRQALQLVLYTGLEREQADGDAIDLSQKAVHNNNGQGFLSGYD